jgi:2-dehydropantoate 2-reductase
MGLVALARSSAGCWLVPAWTCTSWRAARSSRRCAGTACAFVRRLIGDVHVPTLHAHQHASDAPKADLALVCVKAYQTAGILDDLAASVKDSTIIMTLQNGVESDEVVAGRFGWERVVPAAVYVGATIDEPGVVVHEAPARISFGARPGFDPARLETVREVLARTGQRIQLSEDIQRERWRKLMWNASFNTVSAITMRAPADLLALTETRALSAATSRDG